MLDLGQRALKAKLNSNLQLEKCPVRKRALHAAHRSLRRLLFRWIQQLLLQKIHVDQSTTVMI